MQRREIENRINEKNKLKGKWMKGIVLKVQRIGRNTTANEKIYIYKKRKKSKGIIWRQKNPNTIKQKIKKKIEIIVKNDIKK